jgi:K+/H+ antiporter YhaU regulatory subunit KhtT
MFNLLDQYENDGNIINIEQIISILEYITEIVFMSRGNHDSNTMIVKEKLAYKLKIQGDLVYQRYQTIMQSSEWTDGEIDDIALILENTIITNEIDEIIESIIPEMSTYLTENSNVIQDTISMIKQDDINMVDGVRIFTLDDIIDVGDEYIEEKVQDTFPKTNDKKSRQPYIRQNRTGLEDMRNILAGMFNELVYNNYYYQYN